MKRLFWFVLTLLAGPAFATTLTVGCDDLAGTYESVDAYNNVSSYTCSAQTTALTNTCTVALFDLTSPPHTGVWCNASYTATFQTSGTDIGQWDYTATYVSGTCSGLGNPNWTNQLHPTGTTGTCTEFIDYGTLHSTFPSDFLRFVGTDGTNTYPTVAIEIPGTNTSGSYGSGEKASVYYSQALWSGGANGGGTGAAWTAVLQDHTDSTFQFSGRSTTEYIPGTTGCGQSWDGTAALGNSVNSYWSPDITNNYSVGWGTISGTLQTSPDITGDYYANIEAVQHRYNITLPCDVNFSQGMYISSSGTPAYTQYQSNTIIHEFGDGTMRYKRGGSAWSPTYNVGASRKVWRFADWMMFWFPAYP